MNGIAYQLSKVEEEEVVARTNAEIARDHVTSPAAAKEVALRHTLAIIRGRRPEPQGTMHERLVMALGKVALTSVFSPLERELLTTLIDAVEPLYRPTPPRDAEENAIKAADIEALSQAVCEVAVQYIAACRSSAHPDEKYAAIDLWKERLVFATTEYTGAIKENYG